MQKTKLAMFRAQTQQTRRDLHKEIVSTYYLYAATHALVASARLSLNQADESVALTERKQRAGMVSRLDVLRANLPQSQGRERLEDVVLSELLVARSLVALTGLEPASPTDESNRLAPDLRPAQELQRWTSLALKNADALRIEFANMAMAQHGENAARLALVPTLSVDAKNRWTNATGFVGEVSTYSVTANLGLRFDFGQSSQLRASQATRLAADARAQRVRRAIEDSVVEAFHRVNTSVAKVMAAQAEENAASTAAQIALSNFEKGTSTILDVTTAQTESFSANASLLQAIVELAESRATLRTIAGQSVSVGAS